MYNIIIIVTPSEFSSPSGPLSCITFINFTNSLTGREVRRDCNYDLFSEYIFCS